MKTPASGSDIPAPLMAAFMELQAEYARCYTQAMREAMIRDYPAVAWGTFILHGKVRSEAFILWKDGEQHIVETRCDAGWDLSDDVISAVLARIRSRN